ncbi:MAG: type III pantothenate kinase [Eggerthellaceae bacterium]|nr:type III pantothenate kinase [Eggerthellaceae bacterium]
MILAVDIGNTNVAFALMNERDAFESQLRFPTDKRRTARDFMVGFEALLAMHQFDFSQVDGAIVSSVVPELTDHVVQSIVDKIHKDPLLVSHELDLGFFIHIDTPHALGADLIADAAGALGSYSGNLAVFDLGTATTCSIIRNNGSHPVYEGSLIIPGVATSQDALSARCSQLPFISFEDAPALIGKNTVDAMQSGAVNATAAMIDGLIQRIETELHDSVTPVITGGISKLVAPACTKEVHRSPMLIFEGLWDLYHRNCS